MSQLAKDLRSFLILDVSISGLVSSRVHQDHVPDDKALPYIWFAQAEVEFSDELAPAAGLAPFARYFDFECYDSDANNARTLAEAVRNRLAFYRGYLDAALTRAVQGIFVEEHEEGYLPRGHNGDVGLYAATLRARVIPRV